jgi:membrane-anchored protein YejM (alkaline phosphatase superfamily)
MYFALHTEAIQKKSLEKHCLWEKERKRRRRKKCELTIQTLFWFSLNSTRFMIGGLQEQKRANTIQLHPLRYPCTCRRTSTKILFLAPATIARRMTMWLNTEKGNGKNKRWHFTFSGTKKTICRLCC